MHNNPEKYTIYVGIGSNLGAREENCRKALAMLASRGQEIISVSSAFETEPWGVKDQPSFINMAACVRTVLPPAEFLVLLKDIEKEMGRTASERWGPRLIDLDILLWGQLVISEPGFEIPHPMMQERLFVLEPLCEIAPDAIHPVLGKTVSRMLSDLRDAE